MAKVETLAAKFVVGFEGAVPGGLVVHPRGQHIIYPIGAKLVIQNWSSGEQTLLEGHTSSISAVAVSPNGQYLASGQKLCPPQLKATVILWNFESKACINKYEVHRTTVCGLAFSCDSKHLFSISGFEDHCLAVWGFEQDLVVSCKRLPKALQSSEGMAIAAAKICPNFIVTSSEEGLKVWEMDARFQLTVTAVNLGKVKRLINCIMVDDDDSVAYCGSTTGDVVKVRLNLVPAPPHPVLETCMSKPPPKTRRDGIMPSLLNGNYAQGVRAIVRVGPKELVIAAGDGTVDLIEELHALKPKKLEAGNKCPTLHSLKKVKSCKIKSQITSLTKFKTNSLLLLGTKGGDMYSLSAVSFKDPTLKSTSHPGSINSVVVPQVTSEVFVTCGYGDIRIWKIKKSDSKIQEASRILQPGLTCLCVIVNQDGSAIISAWDDGCIRFHAPQSGKLIGEIKGAHQAKVTAIAITSNSQRIVSGGQSGQVRVWDKYQSWSLKKVFGEQRGVIHQVAMKDDDLEAASVCEDGSCYVWKIDPNDEPSCKITLQTTSKLSGVSFFPGSGTLLMTTGMDRKITCWDTATGTAIRGLDTHCSITSLFVPRKGEMFITGFEDGTIRVWSLLKGEDAFCGIGHGAGVTSIAMGSDNSYIISVSSDGSIFYWPCPQQVVRAYKAKQEESSQNSSSRHPATDR